MYATINKNGKFTGAIYDEMNSTIQKWHDDNGLSYAVVSGEMQNIGTEESPDYEEPTAEGIVGAKLFKIDTRLKEIDIAAVRPLRAIQAGTSTQYDIDKLVALDTEAQVLRGERAGL